MWSYWLFPVGPARRELFLIQGHVSLQDNLQVLSGLPLSNREAFLLESDGQNRLRVRPKWSFLHKRLDTRLKGINDDAMEFLNANLEPAFKTGS